MLCKFGHIYIFCAVKFYKFYAFFILSSISFSLNNTKHYLYFSSYRVYANVDKVITEEAPRLLEAETNKEFLDTYKIEYSLYKAIQEDFFKNNNYKNWSIIRPAITYSKNHYDGIINFLHYKTVEVFEPHYKLISKNCDHMIFLSSYRVYSDMEHPITENCPHLLDVIKDDQFFLDNEDYGLGKSRCEKFLKNNPYSKNWTVVRPVISFSRLRFDILLTTGSEVVDAAREGRIIELPLQAKNITAGLEWAGNSAKLIAHLLFKEECKEEAYTISTGHNLKWEEVADYYTELLGTKFEWTHFEPKDEKWGTWNWKYDRAYSRDIDPTKVLKATGLKKEDFKTIKEGIEFEIEEYKKYGGRKK